eukprot:TRINITY_DN11268_c0_g1_i1.p1 TRINITY_DN11268_c0_g1~~TRINITY_DN11268_c0_g1_i1.p1  ORF type:complete len:743 (+),score=148.55 TRINITY_DN11268_c0_g1_i1:133-2361(+)
MVRKFKSVPKELKENSLANDGKFLKHLQQLSEVHTRCVGRRFLLEIFQVASSDQFRRYLQVLKRTRGLSAPTLLEITSILKELLIVTPERIVQVLDVFEALLLHILKHEQSGLHKEVSRVFCLFFVVVLPVIRASEADKIVRVIMRDLCRTIESNVGPLRAGVCGVMSFLCPSKSPLPKVTVESWNEHLTRIQPHLLEILEVICSLCKVDKSGTELSALVTAAGDISNLVRTFENSEIMENVAKCILPGIEGCLRILKAKKEAMDHRTQASVVRALGCMLRILPPDSAGWLRVGRLALVDHVHSRFSTVREEARDALRVLPIPPRHSRASLNTAVIPARYLKERPKTASAALKGNTSKSIKVHIPSAHDSSPLKNRKENGLDLKTTNQLKSPTKKPINAYAATAFQFDNDIGGDEAMPDMMAPPTSTIRPNIPPLAASSQSPRSTHERTLRRPHTSYNHQTNLGGSNRQFRSTLPPSNRTNKNGGYTFEGQEETQRIPQTLNRNQSTHHTRHTGINPNNYSSRSHEMYNRTTDPVSPPQIRRNDSHRPESIFFKPPTESFMPETKASSSSSDFQSNSRHSKQMPTSKSSNNHSTKPLPSPHRAAEIVRMYVMGDYDDAFKAALDSGNKDILLALIRQCKNKYPLKHLSHVTRRRMARAFADFLGRGKHFGLAMRFVETAFNLNITSSCFPESVRSDFCCSLLKFSKAQSKQFSNGDQAKVAKYFALLNSPDLLKRHSFVTHE